MKMAINKITIFFGGNLTEAMNTNATRSTYHFTHHMFGRFISDLEILLLNAKRIFSTDWPLGDIVRPFVRVYTSWRVTVPKNNI